MHRWLNTCCQTCVTSRSLCPSRRDTSPTALNTCNVDTTLKKLPRWSLLKSKPFFGPARHLHPVTTCLLRSHPEAPRNQAFHPGLPPCACTIPLTHAGMSVRVRFCGCEVHPHSTVFCLLSQLLASSASFRSYGAMEQFILSHFPSGRARTSPHLINSSVCLSVLRTFSLV